MTPYGIQNGGNATAIKVRLIVAHAVCLGVFFVPLTKELLLLALLAYFARVFAYEGVAHRYFAHHSFKTSRVFQFLLAVFQTGSGMRGPIWWADHHRKHHRYSDGPLDRHSPVTHSFWYSFVGWLVDPAAIDTDLDGARDLSRFPELVWLNKRHNTVQLAVLLACYPLGQYTGWLGHEGMGLSAVVWLFFLPMLLAVHSASLVNAWTHGARSGLFHHQRFDTDDTSTNSWLLAIPTMGASWHNNHHRCMNASRAGFYWWELDLTYWVLRALALGGLIWDLRQVPQDVLAEGRQADQTRALDG